MKDMKLIGLAAVATLAAACHHDTHATTIPVAATTSTAPAPAPAAPAPSITSDQKASHTLALGGDLVALCGIHLTPSAAEPKFAYDQDELTVDDRNVLEQVATCMTTGPLKGKDVALIGRADPRGTEEYNLALGSRRATSVSDYIQRFGVTKARLPQTTRGALDASGTDPATWASDRRVDLQLRG